MKTPIEHNHAFAQTCPLLLKEEHLENPYLVLEEFFSDHNLGDYRKEIDSWFSAALHEELKHSEPQNLIYFHQQLQTLLNASYLITQNQQKFEPSAPKPKNSAYDQLLKKRQASDPESRADETYAQPYWLTINDRENPLPFLQETLSLENLKHLRLGLQEWLEDGLIKTSCLADTDPAYSFALYQQLHQILEACYLILPKPQTRA